jgi:hypothetical protein
MSGAREGLPRSACSAGRSRDADEVGDGVVVRKLTAKLRAVLRVFPSPFTDASPEKLVLAQEEAEETDYVSKPFQTYAHAWTCCAIIY